MLHLLSMMRWQPKQERNADVLLCDTAGRLHNKKNLMEELRKIYRMHGESIRMHIWRPRQCWMVPPDRMPLHRQNNLRSQMSAVLSLPSWTELPKGGIAVAIQSELDIPVKYIGVGESIDDLPEFDADKMRLMQTIKKTRTLKIRMYFRSQIKYKKIPGVHLGQEWRKNNAYFREF